MQQNITILKKEKTSDKKLKGDGQITPKEKRFAEEYVIDYNAQRAYTAAGYGGTPETVRAQSCRLRQEDRVWDYIKELTKDAEKKSGLSRDWIIQNHLEIANT